MLTDPSNQPPPKTAPDDEIARLRMALADAEARAARWESRFAALTQGQQHGILIADKAGVILFAEATAQRLLNRANGDLIGSGFGRPLLPGATSTIQMGDEIALEFSTNAILWDDQPAYLVHIRDIRPRVATLALLDSALRENRRLTTAMEAMPIAMFTAGLPADGYPIRYVNPTFTVLTGYTEADMLGQNARILAIPGADPAEGQRFREALQTTQPYHGENRVRRKDGRQFWAEVTATPVWKPNGQLDGFICLLIDITERRQAEAALREEQRLLEAFYNTSRALTSSLDLNEVMYRLLDNVGMVIPHNGANIMIIKGDYAHVTYARGANVPTLGKARFALTLTNIQRMISTGEAILITDTTADPNWVVYDDSPWIRSYLGAPIWAFGEIVGFLSLDSATPNFYTPAHRELLRAFAAQAAIALQNARLYEEAVHRSDEIAALNRASAFLQMSLLDATSLEQVAERVVRTIVNEFPETSCAFSTVDWEGGVVRRIAQHGDYPAEGVHTFSLNSPGLVTEAIRTQEAIYAPNAAQHPNYLYGDNRTGSELCIPLVTLRGVVAVIDLQCQRLDAFRPQDRRMLDALAARAAIVIENFRLWKAVVDNTERLEQHVQERTADLMAAHTRLNTILDGMTEGVVYLNSPDGIALPTLTYANPAFCRLLGVTPDQILGADTYTLGQRYFSAESFQKYNEAAYRHVMEYGLWETYIQVIRQDGETFDAHISLINVLAGQQEGFIVIVRDVSQERKLEKQRERFIASASHELRTPLTSVKMRLYLLRRQPEKMTEHLRYMESGVDRMTHLVEDLLDASRFERGAIVLHKAPHSLQNLIKAALDELRPIAQQKGLTLQPDLPTLSLMANIDSHRIAQVVANLIVNAINYTPPEGQITVRLRLATSGQVPAAQISVQDTGIGISPEAISHIFEPFYRVEVGVGSGTGLGLTISKEIVKLHDGQITVESTPGSGSTFTVTLPL